MYIPKQKISYKGQVVVDSVVMADVPYLVVNHYLSINKLTYEEIIHAFNEKNCGINNLIKEESKVDHKRTDYYTQKRDFIEIKDANNKLVKIGVYRELGYKTNFLKFKEQIGKSLSYVIEDSKDELETVENKKHVSILDMPLNEFRDKILNDMDFLERINKFRSIRGHAEITDWIMCSIYGTINTNESNPYPNKVISTDKQIAGTCARQNVTEFFLKIGHSGSKVGNITQAMQAFMKKVYEQDRVLEAIDVMKKELSAYSDRLDMLNEFITVVFSGRGGNEMENEEKEVWSEDKNIILYGPPGTGKTYNTVVYAVAIIEDKLIEEIEKESYSKILERYRKYKENGKIAFTTFHQSYGYEEFIEGIKPKLSDDGCDSEDISYSIEPGIFKRFCEDAEKEIVKTNSSISVRTMPTIWKITLKGGGNNEIKKDCFDNNRIRIGWIDYDKKVSDETIFNSASEKRIILSFQDEMQVGDIVISLYDRETIDGIGIISGNYEYLDGEEDYNRSRKVNWLAKEIKENIYKLNGNHFMNRPTIHKMDRIKVSDVISISEKHSTTRPVSVEENKDNYVFIIDEINRGNISKIFGELISLIEDTKRLGMLEEIKAMLPYSGKEFGIPNNVYIIGTMNTADRSIAILDTALRRRFKFIEMMPKVELINGLEIDGINIEKMLRKINERIEVLYDRDHTIGHAYFIGLKKESTIKKLATIFKNSIIPLLQEYFYEDYSKIQLVLADNAKSKKDYQFIQNEKVRKDLFKGNPDIDIPEVKYKIEENAFENKESYIEIYSEKIER